MAFHSRRWSRVASSMAFAAIAIVGATACYAWLQEKRSTNQLMNTYPNYSGATTLPYPQSTRVYSPGQEVGSNLIPSGAVSVARTVRYSIPIEQQTLVSFLASKDVGTEKKTEARKQLTRMVEQELDSRFASQEAELSLLEKRIADAKTKLAQRTNRKKEIVERRIAELLSEPDDLAWNADGNLKTLNDSLPPSYPNANNVNYPLNAIGPNLFPSSLPSSPSLSPVNTVPLLNADTPEMTAPTQIPEWVVPSSSLPPSATQSLTENENRESPNSPNNVLTIKAAPSGTHDPVDAKNDIAGLLDEANAIEAELAELDGLTNEGKVEQVQQMGIRKRIRKLELGLVAERKKGERDLSLNRLSFELASKELELAEKELNTAQELYNTGAMSNSEINARKIELERAKHKVATLAREIEFDSDVLKEAPDRIQELQKKLEAVLPAPKPASQPVTY